MNTKWLVLFVCRIFASSLHAQKVSSQDVVKVPEVYEREAIYFYEQNWKKCRDVALEAGVIALILISGKRISDLS